MGKMAAQIPAVVENITGLSIQEMLRQLRGAKPNGHRNGDTPKERLVLDVPVDARTAGDGKPTYREA